MIKNKGKIIQIDADLKRALSPFRYEHSIRVAKEAQILAHHYQLDEKKAYLAGLIHDIAREFSKEENTKWEEKYNISFTSLPLSIIHADIGALVAKEKYDLEEDICNAIKYHTIGNASMTLLDKIVFIADKIARKDLPSSLENVKKVAYQNLDEAIILFLQQETKYLKEKNQEMHPDSLELLKKLQENNKV